MNSTVIIVVIVQAIAILCLIDQVYVLHEANKATNIILKDHARYMQTLNRRVAYKTADDTYLVPLASDPEMLAQLKGQGQRGVWK